MARYLSGRPFHVKIYWLETLDGMDELGADEEPTLCGETATLLE
jgi:hypothetical protein